MELWLDYNLTEEEGKSSRRKIPVASKLAKVSSLAFQQVLTEAVANLLFQCSKTVTNCASAKLEGVTAESLVKGLISHSIVGDALAGDALRTAEMLRKVRAMLLQRRVADTSVRNASADASDKVLRLEYDSGDKDEDEDEDEERDEITSERTGRSGSKRKRTNVQLRRARRAERTIEEEENHPHPHGRQRGNRKGQ